MYGGFGRTISSPQGIAAVKLHQADADGSGDDDELTVFSVNSGLGEIVYNPSLLELAFYDEEVGGKKMIDAVGVAADAAGRVAVADRGNDRVVFLDVDDNMHLRFGSVVTLEQTGVALKRPAGLALESGRLYVADSGNHRVVVVDTSGGFVRALVDPDGWLTDPFGVAVIDEPEWNHYESAFLVVTGRGNRGLAKISLVGELQASVSFEEISDRAGGFFYVAIDYYSNVYVTDSKSGCVYKFDRDLNYLTRFECGAEGEGKLDQPRGIAIYRRFGQVFIAENTGASYFWVGTDVLNPSCRSRRVGERLSLAVRFFLTEHSWVTLGLESKDGNILEPLTNKVFMSPGRVDQTYPVSTEAVRDNVADCELYLTIAATPVYSSREHLEVKKRVMVH